MVENQRTQILNTKDTNLCLLENQPGADVINNSSYDVL